MVVVTSPRPLLEASNPCPPESTDPPVIVTLTADEEGKLLTCARIPAEKALLVWMEPPDIITLRFPVAVPLTNPVSPEAAKPFPELVTWPPVIVNCTSPLPELLVAVTTPLLLFELKEPLPIPIVPVPLPVWVSEMAPRPTPVIEVKLVALRVRLFEPPPWRITTAAPAPPWATMAGLFRLSVKPSLPVY
jgi:hypothetical protein